MHKIEESEVLGRYSRMMKKAPLHRRLSAIKNAAGEQIKRCLSEDAPDELAEIYAPKCAEECKEGMNDFELGRLYFFKGDMDKALRHFEEAYSKGETRAERYLGKIYYEQMKNPDTALPFLIRAADNYGHSDLYPTIGKIYLDKNNTMKAIEYLDMAFDYEIDDVYDDLARLYDQTGRPEKSAEIYEEAFKRGNNEALVRLFEIYRNEGDFDSDRRDLMCRLSEPDRKRMYIAEGYFDYMMAKAYNDPDSAQAGLQRMIVGVGEEGFDSWELLFDALIYEGMVPDAIELCRVAGKKKKKAYSKLAQLYLKLNDFDSAEKACKEGIKAGDSSCIYILGSIKEASMQKKEAIKLYEKSAQKNDYRAYMSMAQIYEREGNILKAKENFEYAFMTPTKKLVMFTYLNFLLKNNFIDDAAGVFVEAIEAGTAEKDIYKILFGANDDVTVKLCRAAIKAGHTQAHMWLAQFHILNNDNPRAAEQYRQAADAGIKEAHVLLAKCLYVQGKFNDSKIEFLRAFKCKVNCYKDFAEVLEQEGYYDQAILNYRMAVDMGNSQAYENLISLLIRCGKTHEARMAMEVAIKKNVSMNSLYEQFASAEEIGIHKDRVDIPANELN